MEFCVWKNPQNQKICVILCFQNVRIFQTEQNEVMIRNLMQNPQYQIQQRQSYNQIERVTLHFLKLEELARNLLREGHRQNREYILQKVTKLRIHNFRLRGRLLYLQRE